MPSLGRYGWIKFKPRLQIKGQKCNEVCVRLKIVSRQSHPSLYRSKLYKQLQYYIQQLALFLHHDLNHLITDNIHLQIEDSIQCWAIRLSHAISKPAIGNKTSFWRSQVNSQGWGITRWPWHLKSSNSVAIWIFEMKGIPMAMLLWQPKKFTSVFLSSPENLEPISILILIKQ